MLEYEAAPLLIRHKRGRGRHQHASCAYRYAKLARSNDPEAERSGNTIASARNNRQSQTGG